MSRIVQPEEGLPLVPFEEEAFATDVTGSAAPSLATELLTPEELVRRAKADSNAVRAAAEAEAEEIRTSAREAGHAAGVATGKADGLREYQAMIDTLRTVAERVQAEHTGLQEELARNATDVALAVVTRLLGDLVQGHQETMRHVVTEALQALGRFDSVTIRVHPSLVDVVEQEREGLLSAFAGVGELRIEGDEAVAAGGCLLDTATVQLDATVDMVIERLRAAVAENTGRVAPPEEPEG